jgi:hypothetical protein
MGRENQNENAFGSPSGEQPDYPREEPLPPGCQPLNQVANLTELFFDAFPFLLSYEYSSNIYLIQGDYLTLVDPGNDYTADIELFREGFNPAHLQKMVLTHGHWDHSMGIFEPLRYPFRQGNPRT